MAAIAATALHFRCRSAPPSSSPESEPRRVPNAAPRRQDEFTLALGSCSKPDRPQPLWAAIDAQRPDAFLWLGDIVYADSDDVARQRQLYRAQAERRDYAAFAARTTIVGTWDDHDYGSNGAGKDYPSRAASQQALLDFLGEPAASQRRAQEGVHARYDFGADDRSVRLIVLDARYHRDPPGASGDTLGDVQWRWLQAQLADSPAAVNLIASSYQVIATQHPFEKWANFPTARQRMLDVIATSRARGVVLLSGDRHFAELARLDCPTIGYPLYELTTSGMTHAYRNYGGEANDYRVAGVYHDLNFGVIRADWQKNELVLEARGEHGLAFQQVLQIETLARVATAGAHPG